VPAPTPPGLQPGAEQPADAEPESRSEAAAARWQAAFGAGQRARLAFARDAAGARVLALRRALRQHRKRVARRLRRIEADAARADEAPALRLDAEVLKTALHAVPRGASEVVLPAPWLPGGERRISLRPDEDARAAVDRLFRRARGLEAATEQIARRWTQTEDELAAIDLLRQRLDRVAASDDPGAVSAELNVVTDAARKLGALRARQRTAPPASAKHRRGAAGRALPAGVDAFVAASGAPMFVGRSATANDALLRSLARGRDVWMHVRDRPGAHLVLRVRGRQPAEREDIREATQLVAHRSGVGPGEHAEVIVAEVRQVRRIAGARPGQVTIGQHQVVAVRVDKACVDRIYARRDR
jgi:predicted ribosome quality control (RQC) complex YloA/Tae2 family protein